MRPPALVPGIQTRDMPPEGSLGSLDFPCRKICHVFKCQKTPKASAAQELLAFYTPKSPTKIREEPLFLWIAKCRL
jgi:hypothetical protein